MYKYYNISQVVNIDLGSILKYTEEFLYGEDVCLDKDGK